MSSSPLRAFAMQRPALEELEELVAKTDASPSGNNALLTNK